MAIEELELGLDRRVPEDLVPWCPEREDFTEAPNERCRLSLLKAANVFTEWVEAEVNVFGEPRYQLGQE